MSDIDEHDELKRRRPWVLSFFGLVAIGGLVAMPFVSPDLGETESGDIVRFLGRFHPVLLHLPIGVFAMILLQEFAAMFRKRGTAVPESLFPMGFAAFTAILAVVAGFLLYQGGGYEGDLVERHLWGGLVFAVGAIFTLILKAWAVALTGNPAWYRMTFFLSLGVMTFASHDGASLTHGEGYLTQYAPNPLRRLLGMDERVKKEAATEAPQDPQVYVDIVAPIFERRCVSCHKEGKAKGKLRMDTYELLLKGGKEGPSIEPGSAEQSNIMVRIDLPVDDDEHMPPEGKPDLTEEEHLVIKWWLDSGADPDSKISELSAPEEILQAVKGILKTVEEAAEKPKPVDPKLKKSVDSLAKEFPGAVTFTHEGSEGVSFSALALRGKFDDSGFQKLAPVLPHLIDADFSATQITDQTVETLTAAKELTSLRLSETGITDKAMVHLPGFAKLQSLNLYGTQVTDEGAMKLATMKQLKRLYLWQTSVSDETIALLKKDLPDCEIVTGR